jgi:hypothetical protein
VNVADFPGATIESAVSPIAHCCKRYRCLLVLTRETLQNGIVPRCRLEQKDHEIEGLKGMVVALADRSVVTLLVGHHITKHQALLHC